MEQQKKEDSKALIPMIRQDQALIPDDRIDNNINLAERSERLFEALKKIKKNSLKLTQEDDWSSQNNKPYLEGSGAQKIARGFGISWETIKDKEGGDLIKQVPLEAGHYRFDIPMRFWKGSDSIEYIGTRSSNDPFFTTRYKNEKGQRIQYEQHASQIESGDVKKSAITNAMQGILAFLGMKKPTWKDLEDAGLDVAKIRKEKKVEFKSKGKTEKEEQAPGTESTGQSKHEESSTGKETEKNPAIPTHRTALPKDAKAATPKQIDAIGKMLKARGESLDNVTVSLFNISTDSLEFLTLPEASEIISALQKKGDPEDAH